MSPQFDDPSAAINYLAGTWSNYAQQAANRQISWDPQVSLGCSKAIMESIQQVVNLQAQCPLHVTSTAFGVLPSGTGAKFTGAVNTLGDQFESALGTVKGILTDMMNTFVMAGKQYMNNDAASAKMFQGIMIPSIPVAPGTKGSGAVPLNGLTSDGQTTTPYIQHPNDGDGDFGNTSEYPQGAPQPPGDYGPIGVRQNTVAQGGMTWNPLSLAGLDNPAALDWGDFYTLGQSIDAGSVQSAAEKWSWLSEQLSDAGQNLYKGIQSATNGWNGKGHDAAISAAAYLTGQIIGVGGYGTFTAQDLGYAAAWLGATAKAMPKSANPPSQPWWDIFAGDPADSYRTSFANLYVYGIQESNDNMTGVPTPKPDNGYQVPLYDGKGPQGPSPALPQPIPAPATGTTATQPQRVPAGHIHPS